MARDIQQPTFGKEDAILGREERHPAFGLISASRSQNGPPGATLFDSDIQHQHTVHVTIRGAVRQRSLNHDRHFPDSRLPLVEVELSEAQWASFVSSMNVGNGVPCTIRARGDSDEYHVPGLPYEPRLRESMAEVTSAADKSLAAIREAFEKVKDKPNKGNIRNLEIVLQNAPSNMTFAAKSLSEHAENVVQRARADVEAMVTDKAAQLGLNPADLGVTMPQLEAPADEPPDAEVVPDADR